MSNILSNREFRRVALIGAAQADDHERRIGEIESILVEMAKRLEHLRLYSNAVEDRRLVNRLRRARARVNAALKFYWQRLLTR